MLFNHFKQAKQARKRRKIIKVAKMLVTMIVISCIGMILFLTTQPSLNSHEASKHMLAAATFADHPSHFMTGFWQHYNTAKQDLTPGHESNGFNWVEQKKFFSPDECATMQTAIDRMTSTLWVKDINIKTERRRSLTFTLNQGGWNTQTQTLCGVPFSTERIQELVASVSQEVKPSGFMHPYIASHSLNYYEYDPGTGFCDWHRDIPMIDHAFTVTVLIPLNAFDGGQTMLASENSAHESGLDHKPGYALIIGPHMRHRGAPVVSRLPWYNFWSQDEPKKILAFDVSFQFDKNEDNIHIHNRKLLTAYRLLAVLASLSSWGISFLPHY